MKTKNRYYKGILRCQFQTLDPKKLGNSTTYTQQSVIALEPRFRFDEVEEITEDEFNKNALPIGEPFIRHQQQADVEFGFKVAKDPQSQSSLKKIEEMVLVLEKQHMPFDDGDRYVDSRPIDHFIKPEPDPDKDIYYDVDASSKHPVKLQLGADDQDKYYSPFDAFMGKATHGRIKGVGYCREVEYFDDNNQPLNYSQLQQVQQVQQQHQFAATPIGQLAQVAGILKPQPDPPGITLPPPTEPVNKGCLGGLSSNPGCFSSAGIGGLGCMIPLLLLLLAGLLWWLMGMKGCQNNSTPPPIIIHDTIKVEVQKIDTLTIVKTDTVSYVDSTTKLNYETVNLPNVQFITNSDVLLPSSASDLQKLAEYLIKNDSLNATIFGHTDNVGKPDENLKLSQRRAESVKRFLSSLGVDSKRLQAVGKGDQQPKADNNLEEGRLMNRRVEVQLTNTEFVTTTRTKVEEENNQEKKVKNSKKNEP